MAATFAQVTGISQNVGNLEAGDYFVCVTASAGASLRTPASNNGFGFKALTPVTLGIGGVSDFAPTWIGGGTPVTLTVNNPGAEAATAVTGTVTGDGFAFLGGRFPGTGGTCTDKIAAAAECTIVVEFRPRSTGSLSGALHLAFKAGGSLNDGAADAALHGTGQTGSPGTLDSQTFVAGVGYRVDQFLPNEGSQSISAMALQPDGRIVAAGFRTKDARASLQLLRYQSDGSPDTTFGSGGESFFHYWSAGGEALLAVAVQPDGRIVGAGYVLQDGSTVSESNMGVVRVFPNGSLDHGFGNGGFASIDFYGSQDRAYAVKVLSDGRIAVAGNATNGSAIDMAMAMLRADGTIDQSFGTGGQAVVDFGGADDYVYALLQQTDGKWLLIGTTGTGAAMQIAVARLTTDGQLDTTFGTAGKVTTRVGANDVGAYAAAWQGANFIVGGYVNTGVGTYPRDGLVLRYTPNGALDSTFGTNGAVTLPFPANTGANDQINSLAVQADGKIVTAGVANSCSSGTGNNWATARLLPNGALDAAFGTNGMLVVDVDPVADSGCAATDRDSLKSVLIQPDGKYVVGGQSRLSGVEADAIGRIWP